MRNDWCKSRTIDHSGYSTSKQTNKQTQKQTDRKNIRASQSMNVDEVPACGEEPTTLWWRRRIWWKRRRSPLPGPYSAPPFPVAPAPSRGNSRYPCDLQQHNQSNSAMKHLHSTPQPSNKENTIPQGSSQMFGNQLSSCRFQSYAELSSISKHPQLFFT